MHRSKVGSTMELTLLFGSILIASLGTPVASSAETYRSASRQFSFNPPADWVQFPEEVINELSRLTIRDPGTSPTEYEVGFQSPMVEIWMTPPYVVVQSINFARLGLSRQPYESEIHKFAEAINVENSKDAAQKYSTELVQDNVDNLSIGQKHIDLNRHMILFNGDTNTPESGEIRSQSATFIGKNQAIQITIYDRKDHFEHSAQLHSEMIQSFQFEPAAAYDETQATSHAKAVGRALVLTIVVLVGLVGLVGLVVLAFVLLRKPKPTQH